MKPSPGLQCSNVGRCAFNEQRRCCSPAREELSDWAKRLHSASLERPFTQHLLRE